MPQPKAGMRNHGNPPPVINQITKKKALTANQTVAWIWNPRCAPVISLRVRRSGPRREGDMEHTHPILQPAAALQLREARLDRRLVAHHAGPVGDRHQQWTDVEVALLRAGVDLEGRPARVRRVD